MKASEDMFERIKRHIRQNAEYAKSAECDQVQKMRETSYILGMMTTAWQLNAITTEQLKECAAALKEV